MTHPAHAALDRLVDKIPFDQKNPTDKKWFVDYCTVKSALEDLEWKDINTAPTDGARILAWSKNWSNSMTVQWYGKYWSDYHGNELRFQPTHWKSLTTPMDVKS